MTKDEILKAATWRGAVKEFDQKKKISSSDFEFLLEVARLAPTSYGFEPYNIIVLQDRELREELFRGGAMGTNASKLEASHLLIFTVKNNLSAESEYLRKIMTDVRQLDEETQDKILASFANFQNNWWDLTDDRKRYDWAARQAYIVMANIMLAAAEIGIDSCAIEGFDKAAIQDFLSAHNIIDPSVDSVAVMLALGYRAKNPAPKTRREMNNIVKFI